MAENLVLGRGKLFFAPYAPDTTTGGTKGYFGNTPTLTMTQAVTKLDHYSSEGGLKIKDKSVILQTDITLAFETDEISMGNLLLWFGGEAAANIPPDAPAGYGTVAVIGTASMVYGALFFESDNPVGDNVNYWWPYVMLQPTGTFNLKGDAFQTMGFSAEALKRDPQTERVYIYTPPTPQGTASSDTTPEFTTATASVATGGSGAQIPATAATVTTPATGIHDVALIAAWTMTGGTAGYIALHDGSAFDGVPQPIFGTSGNTSLTPSNTGTYTVKISSDAAGATVIGTGGTITVS